MLISWCFLIDPLMCLSFPTLTTSRTRASLVGWLRLQYSWGELVHAWSNLQPRLCVFAQRPLLDSSFLVQNSSRPISPSPIEVSDPHSNAHRLDILHSWRSNPQPFVSRWVAFAPQLSSGTKIVDPFSQWFVLLLPSASGVPLTQPSTGFLDFSSGIPSKIDGPSVVISLSSCCSYHFLQIPLEYLSVSSSLGRTWSFFSYSGLCSFLLCNLFRQLGPFWNSVDSSWYFQTADRHL